MVDQWWRDAVIYQIYPRSWADGNGDGIGDLPGITARLNHLVSLGVDALWLSPFYTSPQNDAGYDVADFRDVDPLFGTLSDFDALLAKAHQLGLRVIVDLVPNHSSSEHPWFQAALKAEPASPERERYIFRDGRGPDGSEPPNNWQSIFGGSAWERVADGQWYLHLFDVSQPDFNWANPVVGDEMESIIRFWLDRNVDGFRIDVAHGLVKADELPDVAEGLDLHLDPTHLHPMWDQEGVHDVYRRWRVITGEYAVDGADADRVLCGEAWVTPPHRLARYVRPDELHQTFNFDFLMTPWLASELKSAIAASLEAVAPVKAVQTWVLSNHDVVRHASRFGYAQIAGQKMVSGIGIDDPQPDHEIGLRRARAATTVMLALPGSAYLYQGEELGLPDATRLPDEVRQDPTWERSGRTNRGRDGCRVPIPWESASPTYGFSPTGASWLPQPAEYADHAVDAQDGVPGSTLELYRALLRIRREGRIGRGVLDFDTDAPETVVSFTIKAPAGHDLLVMANLGTEIVPLPSGSVVVESTPFDHSAGLPPDVAVWISGD